MRGKSRLIQANNILYGRTVSRESKKNNSMIIALEEELKELHLRLNYLHGKINSLERETLKMRITYDETEVELSETNMESDSELAELEQNENLLANLEMLATQLDKKDKELYTYCQQYESIQNQIESKKLEIKTALVT